MEEKKRIFNTLNSIDFEEFVNIPRPVITIFEVFRQCFAEESRRVTDLHLEINKMTEKVQYKLQSMNEVLANTNESIHHQQEHIMNKMKERSEFLKNDLNVFKVKLNEENISKQKIFDETLSEMKEKLDDCVKIVNSVMTKEEVSKEISDKSTSLHIAICNEVRDQIFKPANDKLTLEIKAISE